jgi:hypothetical protein
VATVVADVARFHPAAAAAAPTYYPPPAAAGYGPPPYAPPQVRLSAYKSMAELMDPTGLSA